MATTIAARISLAEEHKLSAERKVSDNKRSLTRFLEALDNSGITDDKLTDEHMTRMEQLNDTIRSAVDAVKHAEGGIKALRAMEAEEKDMAVQYNTTRKTNAPLQVTDRTESAPAWMREDGRPAAVTTSFADHPVVREHTERMSDRDRHVIGEYGSFGQMVRSLSTTGASAVVPQAWSNQIIDLARANAVVLKAGATVVPMDQKVVNIGRLTADPTAGFRAEGNALGVSDPTYDSVTLTAKALSAQVVASLEFMQDAVNGEEVITNALAQAMGLKLDQVALFGGLASGANDEGFDLPAPNPVGLIKYLSDNASENVLGYAAGGTTITAASAWNEVLDTIYQPRLYNLEPNALIMNQKLAKKLAKTYTSTYEPLPAPADVTNLQRLYTNAIPSYTRGAMTNVATDVFAGKFDEMLVGQRMELEIRVLNERYAELGQVSVVALWRGDIGFSHPRAFSVYRALGGS